MKNRCKYIHAEYFCKDMYMTKTENYEPQDSAEVAAARLKIRPTSDVFISWLFTSERFKHLTLSFINAVLEDAGQPPAKEVEIKNPFNVVDCVTAKETILDLKVKDETGRLYDVEIQNQTTSAFLLRMAYYWAKLYGSQIQKGQDYGMLLPCTIIGLLSDSVYGGNERRKVHTVAATVDRDEPSWPFFSGANVHDYHVIELKKFELNPDALYTVDRSGRKKKLAASLFRWLRFFADGGRKDFMAYYGETDTAVKDAKGAYEDFIADEKMREAELRREMGMHDQAQARADAVRMGREEGHAQGVAEGRAEGEHAKAVAIARRMKSLALADDIIAKATGLTAEEIRNIG